MIRGKCAEIKEFPDRSRGALFEAAPRQLLSRMASLMQNRATPKARIGSVLNAIATKYSFVSMAISAVTATPHIPNKPNAIAVAITSLGNFLRAVIGSLRR